MNQADDAMSLDHHALNESVLCVDTGRAAGKRDRPRLRQAALKELTLDTADDVHPTKAEATVDGRVAE